MGFADRAARAAADGAGTAAQRVRAAMRARQTALKGYSPNAAADLSVNAAVRQAAGGQLPDAGNPATRVTADAAWDPAARSGDEAPLLRESSTPVAELVADDLEAILSEALPVGFDADAVSGVDEGAYAEIQRRIEAVAGGSAVGSDAVRILASRYGLPADMPVSQLAEQLAGGIAGQRTSLYAETPRVVRDSRLERVADNPFPERPSSLEGFPEPNELFDPVEITEQFRIPRFQYDQLGRVKLDEAGNPVPRIDPETQLPTFEPVTRKRLVPQRTVSGRSEVMPVGEFTTIGTRRSGSDGNRSAEEVVFVLNRGDGTYQLSRITDSGGYDNQIIDEGQLGRLMVDSGYDRISGPELGFTVKAPTEGEAEALGRQLFESLQPGAATPAQVAEVVRRIDELGQVFDGALADRALQAAGFRSAGDELASGQQLLAQARELAAAEPAGVTAPRAVAPAPRPASVRSEIEVRPPASSAARGASVTDVVGDSVRRARDLTAGQGLLTPEQRAARELAASTISGPAAGTVDVVSGPADASVFLGPDGQPLTATFDPAALFSDAAPPLFPPPGRIRPGILSGIVQDGVPAGGPGSSSISMGGVFGDGTVVDTGALPGAVPVTMDSSLSMPDRLDVLQGLSDVATPATPVMNFEATPGSWADQTARGTIDVGGVDFARQIDPADADFARQQFSDLANREASVKAILRQFPGLEPTDDLAEIFRRMDEARTAEPAFGDLDVAEQFEMASMGAGELQALADDIAVEVARSPNPNTFTQSQSVASPASGNQFSTAQNLPPVTLDRAARVRQARDPSAPPPAPADSPSDVAFGMNPSRRPPSNRRATEQRATILQARLEAADRTERLLAQVEKMYSPPPLRAGEDPPLPSTPEQVVAFVRGAGDFFRLPKAGQAAVLEAVASPKQATALMDSTIASKRAIRDELRALGPAPERAAGPDDAGDDPLDTPDDVTDIPAQREAASADLAESEANAEFYNSQRGNAGADRRVSMRRAQEIVRRALGIKRGERLPLAFSDYDSRFGSRVSRQDIERLNELRGWIDKYDSMTDDAYATLRARNTELPETRAAKVAELESEFQKLGRLVSQDTVQDADPSGTNQARLTQQLFSDNPAVQAQALRELFAVKGLRDASGERVGEDGLTVLRLLAADPAYGSVENVLYDFLSRDPSINNPEAAVGRIVDERGVERVAAAVGPESLRALSQQLAERAGRVEARQLTPAERDAALLYQVRDGADGLTPQFYPDAGTPLSAETRPSFIDRLRSFLPFGRRPAAEAPPGPPEVTRQGLDTAEAEIAAATTPEEMNAVLARINRVREQALVNLTDANDPPVADGSGVERSARQQITERADSLVDAWRRRMERMQAAGGTLQPGGDGMDFGLKIEADSAFAAAYGEAMQSSGDMREAIRAGNAARKSVLESGGRQVSAEEADELAVPGGGADAPEPESVEVADAGARRTEPRKRVEGVDPEALERLREQAFRNRSLAPVTAEQAAADGLEIEVPEHLAAEVDYELRRRAEARRIAAERGEEAPEWSAELPGLSVNLRQRRAGVSFINESGKPVVLEGRLRSKDEPETDGPAPVPFQRSMIISWSPDGGVQIRQRRMSRSEPDPEWVRRQEIKQAAESGNTARILSLIPPASAADEVAGAMPARAAGEAAQPTAPAARTDDEVMEDFSRPVDQDAEPLEEALPYDSDELDSNVDEDRIAGDIDESLREVSPGAGRRRATEEYEAEQARKAGKGKAGKGKADSGSVGVKRVATGLGAAALAGGGIGQLGQSTLSTLVPAAIGMGFSPASAYGETAPVVPAGDINTSVEPAGSQVREARRRLSYLTTQNPLPY